MADCIFCQIVAKKIPADVKYEDEHILVFPDIAPKAPIHWLIIPKKHVGSMQELTAEDSALVGHLFTQVPKIAQLAGVDKTGHRIVSSTGFDGGQTVPHLHVHLFGGKKLGSWF